MATENILKAIVYSFYVMFMAKEHCKCL